MRHTGRTRSRRSSLDPIQLRPPGAARVTLQESLPSPFARVYGTSMPPLGWADRGSSGRRPNRSGRRSIPAVAAQDRLFAVVARAARDGSVTRWTLAAMWSGQSGRAQRRVPAAEPQRPPRTSSRGVSAFSARRDEAGSTLWATAPRPPRPRSRDAAVGTFSPGEDRRTALQRSGAASETCGAWGRRRCGATESGPPGFLGVTASDEGRRRVPAVRACCAWACRILSSDCWNSLPVGSWPKMRSATVPLGLMKNVVGMTRTPYTCAAAECGSSASGHVACCCSAKLRASLSMSR